MAVFAAEPHALRHAPRPIGVILLAVWRRPAKCDAQWLSPPRPRRR
jgi:hypothetical protein